MFVITIIALFLSSLVESAPIPWPESVTVSGPGVSDHGLPNLVCLPTEWTDVALFFFVNYVVHVASVRDDHGASAVDMVFRKSMCLVMPMIGVTEVLESIARWGWEFTGTFPFLKLPSDNLEAAHRAGALIMATRTYGWTPNPEVDTVYRSVRISQGDREEEDTSLVSAYRYGMSGSSDGEGSVQLRNVDNDAQIQGDHLDLPPGYCWAVVPHHAAIRPWGKSSTMQLGGTFSLIQPLAAVAQAISAGFTIYKTRGDQLDRYGFSSFGLTVVPYLIMSMVNFVAQIAIPKYNTLHIIHSDILDEAMSRAGITRPLIGVVGELIPKTAPAASDSFDVSVERGWRSGTAILRRQDADSTATKEITLLLEDNSRPSTSTDTVIIPRWPITQKNPASSATQVKLVSLARQTVPQIVLSVIFWSISLAAIGAISKFRSGTHSSTTWRAIFILWLVFSIGFSVLEGLSSTLSIALKGLSTHRESTKPGSGLTGIVVDTRLYYLSRFLGYVIACIPPAASIANLVMVGQQLMDYGDCVYFDQS
ncbi:hypothetical protein QBC44DRAFT_263598 [Cladorrhinum sp. PSN332]|nr:hypothetical protein QBC44DRAFT_263598 [Cladorrhinum sp. PSN332]